MRAVLLFRVAGVGTRLKQEVVWVRLKGLLRRKVGKQRLRWRQCWRYRKALTQWGLLLMVSGGGGAIGGGERRASQSAG
jgi:hypothetical protein